MLTFSLQDSLDQLGPNDPWIKTVLNGRTPAQVASEVIQGTKLTDLAVRKALAEGGEAAVNASTDPLVVLARKVDPFFREIRIQTVQPQKDSFLHVGVSKTALTPQRQPENPERPDQKREQAG